MAPFIQGNEKRRLEGDESSELEGYCSIVINVKFVLFAERLFANVTFLQILLPGSARLEASIIHESLRLKLRSPEYDKNLDRSQLVGATTR